MSELACTSFEHPRNIMKYLANLLIKALGESYFYVFNVLQKDRTAARRAFS